MLVFATSLAPPASGGASPWIQFLPFVLILGIFYFIILLPMKRRQRKVQEFLEGLKAGDKVVTSGGLYGTVVRLNGRVVQLQIADKVRVDISRSAIAGLQGKEPVAGEQS